MADNELRIKDDRIGKSRVLQAVDRKVLQLKIALQKAVWETQWSQFVELSWLLDSLREKGIRTGNELREWSGYFSEVATKFRVSHGSGLLIEKVKEVCATLVSYPSVPILQINREDKRFVSSYEVAASIDDSVNLAAMGWEDFEHLVRELFESEFVTGGGEVKVTQASRDGGVDAIAFDPDPIRGGKIVIQAKRYTNVVGVAAVRDLYGTVVNEGAMKGILVTTSEYGPDAYAFAKDKPLTLLNGSNLLHLLDKHGHKAKIDIKAAKALYAGQQRKNKAD